MPWVCCTQGYVGVFLERTGQGVFETPSLRDVETRQISGERLMLVDDQSRNSTFGLPDSDMTAPLTGWWVQPT